MTTTRFVEGEDYYVDPDGLYVFTAAWLLKRGYCCGNGCRHCPYDEGPAAEDATPPGRLETGQQR